MSTLLKKAFTHWHEGSVNVCKEIDQMYLATQTGDFGSWQHTSFSVAISRAITCSARSHKSDLLTQVTTGFVTVGEV